MCKGIWVLHKHPGNYDEPSDFCGVFEEVTAELLAQVGHKDIVWRFRKKHITGHNVNWAEFNAPEFSFSLEEPGVFLVPPRYV